MGCPVYHRFAAGLVIDNPDSERPDSEDLKGEAGFDVAGRAGPLAVPGTVCDAGVAIVGAMAVNIDIDFWDEGFVLERFDWWTVTFESESRTDAVAGVLRGPREQLSFFVIGPDVAHQFARQIPHRSKHSAGDHVALDPGKPQLHLVQPRRIRRREMQAHLRMHLQADLGVLWADRSSAIT